MRCSVAICHAQNFSTGLAARARSSWSLRRLPQSNFVNFFREYFAVDEANCTGEFLCEFFCEFFCDFFSGRFVRYMSRKKKSTKKSTEKFTAAIRRANQKNLRKFLSTEKKARNSLWDCCCVTVGRRGMSTVEQKSGLKARSTGECTRVFALVCVGGRGWACARVSLLFAGPGYSTRGVRVCVCVRACALVLIACLDGGSEGPPKTYRFVKCKLRKRWSTRHWPE